MKRSLAFFALVMIAGAAAFAQTRESVRIYVQSSADNPMHEVFFKGSFEAEIENAGYGLAYRAAASDYILSLVARSNIIFYDDGTQEPAPPNEKQFFLQFTLFRNRDNAEIVSFAFPFTDPMEVDAYSSWLFYQIMTYLPAFVQDYTPAAPPPVEETRGTVPESPWVGPERREITVPGQVSAEELARIQADALEQARQEARREEQARQAAQAQALREEQERQAALAKALEDARQEERERLQREEQARQAAQAQVQREEQERQAALAKALEDARQAAREEALEQARLERARQEEQAREEARVKALEEALKEAQAAGIREIPVPYEIEVYRDREVTKEVEVQVPGEKVIIREPAAAEPDLWRNKKMYLRASGDGAYTYFQIRPNQLLSKDEFRIVPGLTVGLELHFDNWISVEFDFVTRFTDLWDYTVNPGLGFQLKFPLKPAVYLMLEPYLGAAFSFNNGAHSNTRYYIEAGGGFQFGFKGGQSGAWFFDVSFMHTFNNVLHDFIPPISVVSTNTPEILWNRFVIGLGVGYKMGFIDR